MSTATISPPAESSVDPPMTLTKADLAGHLRCSERQVDNLRGVLPEPFKLGAVPRWSRAAIVEWIAEQTSGGPQEPEKPAATIWIAKTAFQIGHQKFEKGERVTGLSPEQLRANLKRLQRKSPDTA